MIELPEHDRYATVVPSRAYIVKHDRSGERLESWEYLTERGAHMALLSWQARQFEGEPRGWIWHYPSCRHREQIDGATFEMHMSPEARLLSWAVEVDGDANEQVPGGTQT